MTVLEPHGPNTILNEGFLIMSWLLEGGIHGLSWCWGGVRVETEDKPGLQRPGNRDTPLLSTQHMLGAASPRPEHALGSHWPSEASELESISVFQSLEISCSGKATTPFHPLFRPQGRNEEFTTSLRSSN